LLLAAEFVDARHKAGHDELRWSKRGSLLWIAVEAAIVTITTGFIFGAWVAGVSLAGR
jgi:hypothetical protein